MQGKHRCPKGRVQFLPVVGAIVFLTSCPRWQVGVPTHPPVGPDVAVELGLTVLLTWASGQPGPSSESRAHVST